MPVINVIGPTEGIPVEGGPCSWTINTGCCEEWTTFTPQAQANSIAWATYVLWALTGRRYGPCLITIRPCSPKCGQFSGYMTFPVGEPSASGSGQPWMVPFIDNGIWRNCGCTGGCSCRAACEIPLPGIVFSVDEVMIDGVVLNPSAYRLDRDDHNGFLLVRTDGGCWPECQDMALANDAVGAFTVTFQQGTPVPIAGQIAAGQLACEFARACSGAQGCTLPSQLVSLSRAGVDVQVVDPTEALESGLTGIKDVDLWIKSVNPARLGARPRVLSADMKPVRYVT